MSHDPTFQPYADPLKEWLEANGVDWDRVIAWPQIVMGQLGELGVEQFHHDEAGRVTIHRGSGGSVYTRLHYYPLAVRPDPEFWAAYQHSRTIALRREELRQLARDLRGLGGNSAGPVVVVLAEGDSLMFVTSDRPPTDQIEKVTDALKAILPGVQVTTVSGFQTVMHKQADRGQAGLL